jgi:hypothetical protein
MASSWQQWLRERTCTLRHTYALYKVSSTFPRYQHSKSAVNMFYTYLSLTQSISNGRLMKSYFSRLLHRPNHTTNLPRMSATLNRNISR